MTTPQRKRIFTRVLLWLVPVRIILSATLSVADVATDIGVVILWLHSRDLVWATFSLTTIIINTFVQVVVGRSEEYGGNRVVGAGVGLFHLTHVAAAYRSLGKWWRGEELTLDDGWARTMELLFEACPQTFLQLYVIVHQGFTHARPFNIVSVAISFLCLTSGLAVITKQRLVLHDLPPFTVAQEVLVVGYVLSDMVVRVLSLCLFANAFRVVSVPFLVCAVGCVAATNWVYDRKLLVSLLIAPVSTLSPFCRGGPLASSKEKCLIVLSTIYCCVFLCCALVVPNAWQTSEDKNMKHAIWGVGLGCVVVKLLCAPVYVQAKYGREDGVMWLTPFSPPRNSNNSHHQLHDTTKS